MSGGEAIRSIDWLDFRKRSYGFSVQNIFNHFGGGFGSLLNRCG
jgi:hypothetical protein